MASRLGVVALALLGAACVEPSGSANELALPDVDADREVVPVAKRQAGSGAGSPLVEAWLTPWPGASTSSGALTGRIPNLLAVNLEGDVFTAATVGGVPTRRRLDSLGELRGPDVVVDGLAQVSTVAMYGNYLSVTGTRPAPTNLRTTTVRVTDDVPFGMCTFDPDHPQVGPIYAPQGSQWAGNTGFHYAWGDDKIVQCGGWWATCPDYADVEVLRRAWTLVTRTGYITFADDNQSAQGIELQYRKSTGHDAEGWPKVYQFGRTGTDRWDSGFHDSVLDASQDALFVTGPTGQAKTYLARIDLTSGAVAWELFDDRANGTPRWLAAAPDGGVVAAGLSPDGRTLIVQRYGAAGNQVWRTPATGIGGAASLSLLELGLDDTGNVYVAGNAAGTGPGLTRGFVAALTADGRYLGAHEMSGFMSITIGDMVIARGDDGPHVYLSGSYQSAPDAGDQHGTYVARLDPDRDGDGLSDAWETDGIDGDGDGVIDVTLTGGSPDHKDLHVIVTRMANTAPPAVVTDALADVVAAFAAAPVSNPDAQPGIRLHIHEDSEEIDLEHHWIFPDGDHKRHWVEAAVRVMPRFATATASSPAAVQAAIERVAHYAIFANRIERFAGRETVGVGEIGGNALVIAAGALCAPDSGVCTRSEVLLRDVIAGAFMHELGHNLGLRHGGDAGINFVPSYHSVMNYWWSKPRCTRAPGLPSLDCPAGQQRTRWRLDYSRGTGNPIDEHDIGALTAFSSDPAHDQHWVPVGPADDIEQPRLVPEGDVVAGQLWRVLALEAERSDDGRLQRDLNKVHRGFGEGSAYDDNDDWGSLDFQGERDLRDFDTNFSGNLEAEDYAGPELEGLRCADPYYGSAEYVDSCPCTPGEIRACGGPEACALGSQTCGSDGIFAACEGAVLPAPGAACASTACAVDVTDAIALGAGGAPVELAVATPDECGWVATPLDAWLAVSPDRATGDGSTAISATVNGSTARTGHVAVNGVVVPVTQAGDTQAPTATVLINDGAAVTGSSNVTVTIVASDPNGVPSMCLSTIDGTCSAFVPFAPSVPFTLSGFSGSKNVYVTLRDGLGNTSPRLHDSILVDRNPPTGGTITGTQGDGRVDLAWSGISDVHTGVVGYRLVGAVGTAAPACATGPIVYEGTATSFAHTGLDNGPLWQYRLCAYDLVGNPSEGLTIAVRPVPETTPPTGSLLIEDGAVWTRDRAVTLSFDAEDASGVTEMCFSQNTTCSAWKPFAATASLTVSQTSGTATVRAWYRDTWFNTSGPFSDGIKLDLGPPTDGALTATAASGTATLTWTAAADSTSGVAGYRVVFTTGATAPASCNTGTAVGDVTDLALTLTGLVDGTRYNYRVCARDVAGNMSTGKGASVVPAPEYDPPVGTMVINGGADVTGSTAVTLTIDATDASGVSQMCISAQSPCNSSWIAFAPSKSSNIAAGTGNRTLHLWLRDPYGNTSGDLADSILLDQTGPVDGTLGATTAPGAITLTWTAATDAHTAVASYKVVKKAGTSAPSSKCTSGTVVPSDGLSVTVAATAATAFRVCAIDAVGNVSTGVTVTATP
jgi:hypothetical protein